MNLWSSVGFRHVLTLKLHPPPALRLSSNKWVKALMTLSHSSWVISIFWLNVFVQTESSLLAIRKNGLFAALWLHKFKCFSLFLKSCKRRHSRNVQIWRIKKNVMALLGCDAPAETGLCRPLVGDATSNNTQPQINPHVVIWWVKFRNVQNKMKMGHALRCPFPHMQPDLSSVTAAL